MIISRTPFRISFFGGGTDYPAWYLKEGGAVLSTTIDKHLYISARYLPPFFDMRHRIVWSKVENVWSIDDIQHPVIREGAKYLGFSDDLGLDIHYQADLPARSGMGSSSAFAVGMLNVLAALKGERTSNHVLARQAIELEQDVLQEAVGAQDQVAAAHGGFNRIDFGRDGEIRVEPIVISPERLEEFEDHLMLFYTGISRFASKIAAEVIANIPNKADTLRQMHAMVDDSIDIVTGKGPIADIGVLLDQAWQMKRGLADCVSSSHVDDIYAKAKAAGALGGKLLGAGGSGFIMLFVPPERAAAVRAALSDLLHVPFRMSRQGSAIIHYDPETYSNFSHLDLPAKPDTPA